MIYGYIRVSSDKQTVENQRFEISNFCVRNEIIIDRWVEETVSGTKEVKDRKLGILLKKLKKGDTLICSELSRLGRNMLMIMSFLNECMNREIMIWTIKDNYRLGNDITAKVLAFAFGLAAEIERNLISQRTKEALARKRLEGVVLGRPKGKKSNPRCTKLGDPAKIAMLKELLPIGLPVTEMARILKVHRLTLAAHLKNEEINYVRKPLSRQNLVKSQLATKIKKAAVKEMEQKIEEKE